MTLCNFLNACGTGSSIVSVSGNDTLIPTVQFIGSSSLSTYRYLSVGLEASAYTESCSGEISYRNLQYSYSLSLVQYRGSAVSSTIVATQATQLRSISANAAIFRLNSYQLYAPATYRVTLVVTTTTSAISTTVTSSITVAQGNIVASIRGGSVATIRTDVLSTIDASSSYDQDVSGLTGAVAGLSFVWSCVQTLPTFNQSCGNTISLVSGINSERLLVTPVGLQALNTTSQLTVSVYDTTRSSTATVTVGITTTAISTITITTASSALTSVSTSQRLSIAANLLIVSPCTASWSVNDVTLNLPSIALTASSRSFNTGANQAFNLVLSRNVLPQRATLVFSLVCGNAQSSVTVTTNGAPLPGSFLTYPSTGSELSTSFLFSASSWSDPDLPVTYQFSFKSASSDLFLTLLARSSTSYVASTMSSGTINCSLQAFDVFNALVTVYQGITVNPLSSADKASQLTDLIASAASTGGVASQKVLLSVASSSINTINCTLAPNCTYADQS